MTFLSSDHSAIIIACLAGQASPEIPTLPRGRQTGGHSPVKATKEYAVAGTFCSPARVPAFWPCIVVRKRRLSNDLNSTRAIITLKPILADHTIITLHTRPSGCRLIWSRVKLVLIIATKLGEMALASVCR